jgi:hypothetical protein
VEVGHGPHSGFHFDLDGGGLLFFLGEFLAGIGGDVMLLHVIGLGENGSKTSSFVVIPWTGIDDKGVVSVMPCFQRLSFLVGLVRAEVMWTKFWRSPLKK